VKILHLGKYYPPAPGGMERFLQDLAEEQVRQGHQVQVLCHQHPTPHMDAESDSGLKNMAKTPAKHHPVIHRQASWGPILHTPIMRAARRHLRALLRRFQPDVIHLHWPNPVALWWLPVLARQPVPVVVQWHSDTVTDHVSPLVKAAYFFLRPFERALLRHAKAVVCSSGEYAEHSPILRQDPPTLATIPLGMNFAERLSEGLNTENRDWAEKQWRGQGIRLLSLGRLSFYKNLTVLLKAVALSQEDGDQPVQLVVAGDGPMAAQWQALSRKMGLRKSVFFTGELPQARVNALFSSGDVFALASNDRAESFGLVLLEALWHGMPLLVAKTRGSGMSSLLNTVNAKNPAGLLFDPDSAADALVKIRRASQLGTVAGFALNARHAAVSAYDIAPVCRQWSHLYQSLTAVS